MAIYFGKEAISFLTFLRLMEFGRCLVATYFVENIVVLANGAKF